MEISLHKTKAERLAMFAGQKPFVTADEMRKIVLGCFDELKPVSEMNAQGLEDIKAKYVALQVNHQHKDIPTLGDSLNYDRMSSPHFRDGSIYTSPSQKEDWKAFQYGDKAGLMHIEKGEPYSRVSLFFNTVKDNPLTQESWHEYGVLKTPNGPYINDSNVRMVNDEGYKLELELLSSPTLQKLEIKAYTSVLMRGFLEKPESAKVKSISIYNMRECYDDLCIRNTKGCGEEISNENGAIDKVLDIKALLKSDGIISPEMMIAEAIEEIKRGKYYGQEDKEDRTAINWYNHESRKRAMQIDLYSELFRKQIAYTLKSTLKEHCLWQETLDSIQEYDPRKSDYPGRVEINIEGACYNPFDESYNNYFPCEISLPQIHPGQTEVDFSIKMHPDKNGRLDGLDEMPLYYGTTKDVGSIVLKGKWDVSKLPKPQYDMVAVTSFAKALNEHPETVKFLEYEVLDHGRNRFGTVSVEEYDKIREKAINKEQESMSKSQLSREEKKEEKTNTNKKSRLFARDKGRDR